LSDISCPNKKSRLAVWAITPRGAKLAKKIAKSLADVDLHFSSKLGPDFQSELEKENIPYSIFKSLSIKLSEVFNDYEGHIFIMSTGIVVRLTVPLVRHKTIDPAVVVVDEAGRHAISLLSGHIGGGNSLTKRVASLIGADPVITTATDINGVPAIDLLAGQRGLVIENPEAIKRVNMAFLTGRKIDLHDPLGLLVDAIPDSYLLTTGGSDEDVARVFIDDAVTDLPAQTLVLRPKSLVAGMGCNRGTSMEEMKSLLYQVLDEFRLSPASLRGIASIDIKADEPGLLELAKDLELPVVFYDKEELNKVKNIKNPSAMVEKHTGAKSVCEAAAILSAKRGKLIVPKHSTRNVTVAIARIPFTS